MFLGAGMIPRILGQEYMESAAALRGLALLPALKAFHYLAADTLTGAGYQRSRSRIQLGVAALNVGLCLWLIPAYSWRGAVAASLACDGSLALVLWSKVIRLRARDGGKDEISHLSRNEFSHHEGGQS